MEIWRIPVDLIFRHSWWSAREAASNQDSLQVPVRCTRCVLCLPVELPEAHSKTTAGRTVHCCNRSYLSSPWMWGFR